MTDLYLPREGASLLPLDSPYRSHKIRPGTLPISATRDRVLDNPLRLDGIIPHMPASDIQPVPTDLYPVLMTALQNDAPAEYTFEKAGNMYHATNAAHQLHAHFTPVDVTLALNSKVDGATAWQWKMELVGVGYGDTFEPLPTAALVAENTRLEYQRGSLTEWYVNGPLGLEQGFTLQEAPERKNENDPLIVELAFSGDVSVVLAEDGQRLQLTTLDKLTTISYEHLYVTDSLGYFTPVHMELRDSGTKNLCRVKIVVDDRNAVYPLIIDPTIQQQFELIASDGISGDYFGGSLSLSGDGNTALIGASSGLSHKGATYVFVYNGGIWLQQAKLLANDGVSDDYFGGTVSLSGDGNTALIGASGNLSNTGTAYVFVRSGGTWSQQAKLLANDGASNDHFGYSLALSGDGNTALIGAAGNLSNTGAAYVFTRSGSIWSLQIKLTASDGLTYDDFGLLVKLSGDGNTALIGTASDIGAAYVFVRNGGVWSQQAKLTGSDYMGFGSTLILSADSNMVLVGVYQDNNVGAAYVFMRTGNIWSLPVKLTADDGMYGDSFGHSIALSADNSTALIGAAKQKNSTGAAYVFVRNGGIWSQQIKLTANDSATYDSFGTSVTLSKDGNTALINSINKNGNEGVTYVFTRNNNIWSPYVKELTASDASPTAHFRWKAL